MLVACPIWHNLVSEALVVWLVLAASSVASQADSLGGKLTSDQEELAALRKSNQSLTISLEEAQRSNYYNQEERIATVLLGRISHSAE